MNLFQFVFTVNFYVETRSSVKSRINSKDYLCWFTKSSATKRNKLFVFEKFHPVIDILLLYIIKRISYQKNNLSTVRWTKAWNTYISRNCQHFRLTRTVNVPLFKHLTFLNWNRRRKKGISHGIPYITESLAWNIQFIRSRNQDSVQ